MRIGERIRITRLQQGLTIDALADRLGKNRTTIYRYENGDIENLPLGILDSLAEALNTTPAYLMGWSESDDKHIEDPDTGLKMKHVKMWREALKDYVLTEEESKKILEYAKFLISLRKN